MGVKEENIERMGYAKEAMFTTIITRNNNRYEVDHTLEEVYNMIDDARRRQVGNGTERQHIRRLDVVFRRIIRKESRSDSLYRQAVVVNVDDIVEYVPLDEYAYSD